MEEGDTDHIITTTTKTKTKEIERRFNNYRRKRKRPCKVASIPTSVQHKFTDNKNTATASHGFISVIGRRRAMEDAVRVVPRFVTAEHSPSGYDFFAVYDGHGGTVVANACRERMHLLLAEEVKQGLASGDQGFDWFRAMYSCFMRMDNEIGGGGGDDDVTVGEGNTAGSTAAVVVVGKEEIVVANCGDSRAVLCRGGLAIQLSRDHKPDLPDEKERIEAAGGRVIGWNGNRVLGVLATSRSIGDHCMKPFVISKPEINVDARTELDEFLVVATDGLWDVVTNEYVCEVVRSCLRGQMRRNMIKHESTRSDHAAEAATLLAELAMARGSKDNISIIVIQLQSH
ncbi:probable protein phosphatase 2C 8 [Lotus japonicus]|uniref:probable protein phosphatase 2C 8 n=1 Tax=Lotus japonicus TaxID=34305 RepID=UPI00258C7263|nr:probable protein phosphatase 2C 8 [Lotus japonicus]